MLEVAKVEAKVALVDDKVHKGDPKSKTKFLPQLKSDHAKKVIMEADQVIEKTRKKLAKK